MRPQTTTQPTESSIGCAIGHTGNFPNIHPLKANTMKTNSTPIITFRVIQDGRIVGMYGSLSSARRAARNCYASKKYPVCIDKETTDPITEKSIYTEIQTITE